MRTDAGHPNGHSRNRLPTVEVPLTWTPPRAQTPSAARLNVAWLVLGLFALTTVLAGTAADHHAGEHVAAGLIVPLYVATIAALAWTGFETWSTTRRRPQP